MDSLFSAKEEQIVKNEILDQRHWVVLFIAGVTLCAVFFAFGLFVGRWSAMPDGGMSGSRMTPSLLPPNETAAPSVSTASASDKTSSANGTSPDQTGGSSSSPLVTSPMEGVANDNAASASPPATAAELSSTSSTPPEEAESREGFSVRVGQFEKSKDAESLAETLRSRGFVSATAEAVKSDAATPRYEVLLGPWVDRDSAVRTMNELRNQGVTDVSIVSH